MAGSQGQGNDDVVFLEEVPRPLSKSELNSEFEEAYVNFIKRLIGSSTDRAVSAREFRKTKYDFITNIGFDIISPNFATVAFNHQIQFVRIDTAALVPVTSMCRNKYCANLGQYFGACHIDQPQILENIIGAVEDPHLYVKRDLMLSFLFSYVKWRKDNPGSSLIHYVSTFSQESRSISERFSLSRLGEVLQAVDIESRTEFRLCSTAGCPCFITGQEANTCIIHTNAPIAEAKNQPEGNQVENLSDTASEGLSDIENIWDELDDIGFISDLDEEDVLREFDFEASAEDDNQGGAAIVRQPVVEPPTSIPNDINNQEFKRKDLAHSVAMRRALRQRFRLQDFRPGQMEAINAVMLGFDCFVVLPTGSGKSIIYQLPALLSQGLTLVVSPLKSLMFDQLQKLEDLGILAGSMNGDVSAAKRNQCLKRLRERPLRLKILYITPEQLISSTVIQTLLETLYSESLLSRFAIDEAHCVSAWGHDFRPEYSQLGFLRAKFDTVPILALTATATLLVRAEIVESLQMRDTKWFLANLNRPNIIYNVLDVKKGVSWIQRLVKILQTDRFRKKSGIVYCLSRNDCDLITEKLSNSGIRAVSYHAKLSNRERNQNYGLWASNKAHVMCATTAFGMGIDKADVRVVVHYSIPMSLECYYQESGRGGRDGELSESIIFYSYGDVLRTRKLIKDSASEEGRFIQNQKLNQMVEYCENRLSCRREFLLKHFGEDLPLDYCHQNRKFICSICSQYQLWKEEDVTVEAAQITETVIKRVNSNKKPFKLSHLIDIFMGISSPYIRANGDDKISLFGRGKRWGKDEVQRLLTKMVVSEVLTEEIVMLYDKYHLVHIRPGRRADFFLGDTSWMGMPVKKRVAKLRRSMLRKEANLITIYGKIWERQEECRIAITEYCERLRSEGVIQEDKVPSQEEIIQTVKTCPRNGEGLLDLVPGTKLGYILHTGSGQMIIDLLVGHNADKDRFLEQIKSEQTKQLIFYKFNF